jgi:hypothetical protein
MLHTPKKFAVYAVNQNYFNKGLYRAPRAPSSSALVLFNCYHPSVWYSLWIINKNKSGRWMLKILLVGLIKSGCCVIIWWRSVVRCYVGLIRLDDLSTGYLTTRFLLFFNMWKCWVTLTIWNCLWQLNVWWIESADLANLHRFEYNMHSGKSQEMTPWYILIVHWKKLSYGIHEINISHNNQQQKFFFFVRFV